MTFNMDGSNNSNQFVNNIMQNIQESMGTNVNMAFNSAMAGDGASVRIDFMGNLRSAMQQVHGINVSLNPST